MIDAFACLSIATAIAQFIDFGSEVVKKAHHIQQNGSIGGVVEDFERDINTFRTLCNNLRQSANEESATEGVDGHALPTVAMQCERVADKIGMVLAAFKVEKNPSKWRSFKVAVKLQIKAGELEKCEKLLLATKMEFCTQVLNALRSDRSTVVTLLKRLEERNREMHTELGSRILKLRGELKKELSSEDAGKASIAQRLQDLGDGVPGIGKSQVLLASLCFDAMREREERVTQAHAQTFGWMFSDKSNFANWLSSSSGLFWITGKAGSGKSTMMKYLLESEGTHSRLRTWAGGRKLVVSRHFFWHAGTPMQKSYQGLLQALCFDIFRGCPDLLPHLCKDKWASISATTCLLPSYMLRETWKETDMSRMIEEIGNKDLGNRGTCIFILIDGLDEFHGQHDELNKAVIALSKLPNIKICVASRPWNVFQEYFSETSTNKRSVVMQNLTSEDIGQYVRDRLQENQIFLKMMNKDNRCNELALEITEKADGVFLWVYLVINELLKSLVNHDDYPTLQRRLRRIPPGLKQYFKYMFENLDEFYHCETAQILRATLASFYKLPSLALAVIFASEPRAARLFGKESPVELPHDTWQLEAILERRTAGCGGDLLEIKRGRLDFLHRTLRDFLATDDMIHLLDERSGKDFDIDVAMCHMSLVSIKRYLDGPGRPGVLAFLAQFCAHARKLEKRKNRSLSDLHLALRSIMMSKAFPFNSSSTEHLQFLATMNLRLELECSLKASRLSGCKETLTTCAKYALSYLLFVDRENWNGSGYTTINEDLLKCASAIDPDRREFQSELLTKLLGIGAVRTELWNWTLPLMYSERIDCSEYLRAMFLKVSRELISLKPAQPFVPNVNKGADPRIPTMTTTTPTSSTDLIQEAEALDELFGPLDGQWLLSLRPSIHQPLTTEVGINNLSVDETLKPHSKLRSPQTSDMDAEVGFSQQHDLDMRKSKLEVEFVNSRPGVDKNPEADSGASFDLDLDAEIFVANRWLRDISGVR